jgi:hypothetical protein
MTLKQSIKDTNEINELQAKRNAETDRKKKYVEKAQMLIKEKVCKNVNCGYCIAQRSDGGCFIEDGSTDTNYEAVLKLERWMNGEDMEAMK